MNTAFLMTSIRHTMNAQLECSYVGYCDYMCFFLSKEMNNKVAKQTARMCRMFCAEHVLRRLKEGFPMHKPISCC